MPGPPCVVAVCLTGHHFCPRIGFIWLTLQSRGCHLHVLRLYWIYVISIFVWLCFFFAYELTIAFVFWHSSYELSSFAQPCVHHLILKLLCFALFCSCVPESALGFTCCARNADYFFSQVVPPVYRHIEICAPSSFQLSF